MPGATLRCPAPAGVAGRPTDRCRPQTKASPRARTAGLGLLAASVLTACSSGRTSAADAESYFEQRIVKQIPAAAVVRIARVADMMCGDQDQPSDTQWTLRAEIELTDSLQASQAELAPLFAYAKADGNTVTLQQTRSGSLGWTGQIRRMPGSNTVISLIDVIEAGPEGLPGIWRRTCIPGSSRSGA